jgi:hypothetical protein
VTDVVEAAWIATRVFSRVKLEKLAPSELIFMEHEGSLHYSKELEKYPEPVKFISQPHTLSL